MISLLKSVLIKISATYEVQPVLSKHLDHKSCIKKNIKSSVKCKKAKNNKKIIIQDFWFCKMCKSQHTLNENQNIFSWVPKNKNFLFFNVNHNICSEFQLKNVVRFANSTINQSSLIYTTQLYIKTNWVLYLFIFCFC